MSNKVQEHANQIKYFWCQNMVKFIYIFTLYIVVIKITADIFLDKISILLLQSLTKRSHLMGSEKLDLFTKYWFFQVQGMFCSVKVKLFVLLHWVLSTQDSKLAQILAW